ncbi:AAA family ATPase, partial [Ruegeria sp. 2012CJ41-6]
MYIRELRLKNFRCFGGTEEVISLDPEMTAIIGDNGSGKTTVLKALQRLFGSTSAERSLSRDDVHFGAGEVPGPTNQGDDTQAPPVVSSREIYVEAILDFPELINAPEEDSSSVLDVSIETFHAMSCAGSARSTRRVSETVRSVPSIRSTNVAPVVVAIIQEAPHGALVRCICWY